MAVTPAELVFYESLMSDADLPTLADLLKRPSWQAAAACRDYPAVVFFPDLGGVTTEAKAVCMTCLVRVECGDYAVANGEVDGIWGGQGPRARKALRRAHRAA